MQFNTDGKMFKAARITGPKHNYLGLGFAEDGEAGQVVVEPLTMKDTELVALDASEVEHWVRQGVDIANQELGTNYRLRRIEFVVSDSPPAEIYEQLASQILKRLHNQPAEFNSKAS